MQNLKTELTRVIYNAATQAFEARVTVHGADGPQSYACAIDAPITLSFEDAAKGPTRQAMASVVDCSEERRKRRHPHRAASAPGPAARPIRVLPGPRGLRPRTFQFVGHFARKA